MQEALKKIDDLAKDEDYSTALVEIQKLLEVHPNEAKIWATRAYVNGRKGDKVAAINDWTNAIKIVEEPHYVYIRGIDFFCLGKYQEAVVDFTRVIELCDFYKSDYYRMPAYFFRADSYQRLQEYDKARSDLGHVDDEFTTWTDRLRNKKDILADCT